uniref:Retrovirus-related Pol polyprotein from transposon TNT 1-94-like beta-barrel domain-containing protein n=1 Tax=Oryza punctata TaxID=4537 RepID=A0A0E0MI59_ORYPU
MVSSTSLSLSFMSFLAWVLLIAAPSGSKDDDDDDPFPSEEKRNMEFPVHGNTGTIDDQAGEEEGLDAHRVPEEDSEAPTTTFILDSGASMHATGNLALLSRFVQVQQDSAAVFHARDGRVLRVAGAGAIAFGDYHIPNVSYVPQLGLRTTLVSVQQLAGCGYFTLVSGGCCSLRHHGDGSLVGRARLQQDDGLYHLQYLTIIHDIPPPPAASH